MAQNIDEMMQETPVLTFEPFGQEKKDVYKRQQIAFM